MSILCFCACAALIQTSGHSADAAESHRLQFDPSKLETRHANLDGKGLSFEAVENVVYVSKPVDMRYQTLNIYVPEPYFHSVGVNGYTKTTAPIFLPNSIGGYMPGAAQSPDSGMDRMHHTVLKALARGYVVVAPGARGRTLKGSDGKYTGKAPAALVDLKAAIRYLKFNRGRIPGNVDRIVSNGTSAGGAMSALLGATGNHRDYLPFLKAIGAANASDDVWAVSAYCPITNLDNADTAYEWLLNGVNESRSFRPAGMPPMPAGGPPRGPGIGGPNPFGQPISSSGAMNATQIANSKALKDLFPTYLNELRLRGPNGTLLSLDREGNGSFKDLIRSLLITSAKVAQAKGTDVSKTSWVTVRNGQVTDIDWNGFVRGVGRMKQTSAFDSPSLSTGENNLFGTGTINNQHFTPFGMTHSTVTGATMADATVVKMMNPMSYLGIKGAKVARLWRIRHGVLDRDTSVAIPTILAIRLQNIGCRVDFALPWNTHHSGDYDLDELFDWIDTHAKE